MAERELDIVIAAKDGFSKPLTQAEKAFQSFSGKIGDSSQSMEKGFGSLGGSIMGIRAAWLQVAGVVASAAWLVAGAEKSYEAEIAFNKLRIQVDALGISYAGQEAAIDSAIAATSRYAIVQDEDVAAVLQQLILHTGNLAQSTQNLNLVYDLAYMKGIDVATASTIVGKAMAGNVEGLGRLFPELKNVDDLLGKYASTADKAAYAQAFFREKVDSASSHMTEHELAVKRVKAAYESAHQKASEFAIFMADKFISDLKKPGEALDWLAEKINGFAAKVNPNIVATKNNTDGLMDYEKAKLLVGSAHEKTADQIAAAAKKESDAVEAQFERIKKMTVPEGGGSLQAFILGGLDMPELSEKVGLTAQLVNEKFTNKMVEAAKVFGGKTFATELSNSINTGIASSVDSGELGFSMSDISIVNRDDLAASELLAWQEDFNNSLLSQKASAINALADLDRNSPYAPTGGDAFVTAMDSLFGSKHEAELLALQDFNTRKLQLMVDAGATQYQLEQEYEQLTTAMKQRETSLRLDDMSAGFGAMSSMMQNLTVLTGKEGGEAFKAMKAFAIAETAIQTYRAAQGSFAALAPIPVVGPALAIAAAASATIAGMARVKQIASMQPGGTASGTTIGPGGTANPSYSGGSPNAYPVPTRTEEKGTQNITVIVQALDPSSVNWDKMMEDNIAPALERLSGNRNVELSIKVAPR